MVEPVRHRRTKGAETDMFEPKATASHLDSTRNGHAAATLAMSALEVIVLQKSKVASARIFGETLKREGIDDSSNLSRVTEVAYEFSVRRRGPSDLYTKTARTALRIFDAFGKTTFATLSANRRLMHRSNLPA